MALQKALQLSFLVITLSIKNGYPTKPGTFFWKPSLSIDLQGLSRYTTQTSAGGQDQTISRRSRGNIQKGVVVMINGYDAGMTVMALVIGAPLSKVASSTFNPFSAHFYTNAYRWGLRHLSMLPQMFGGSKSYYQTTLAWKRRFYFSDTFVPKIFRQALPYVKKEEWDQEEKEMAYFKKYAEVAFGKGNRYPNKRFNDFKSWETKESKHLEMSSISTEEIKD